MMKHIFIVRNAAFCTKIKNWPISVRSIARNTIAATSILQNIQFKFKNSKTRRRYKK